MKLIIDIDEDTYKCTKKCDYCNRLCNKVYEIYNAIADGTPLPKGKWVISKCRDGCYLPCCSVCGESSGTYYETNYCPNCGAEIEETDE